MKRKLLIIDKIQFGYHTGNYMQCKYLANEYSIEYICFDSGFKKHHIDGVNIKYVSSKGIRTIRGIRFLIRCILCLSKFKGVIFITYFEKCEFLKRLFSRKKMILDIRTLSINKNVNLREIEDINLKNTLVYFDYVTIISDGLRQKLNISKSNSFILPLGSDIISETNKTFEKLRLLYVGTLNGRNVHQTIEGLQLFLKNHKNTEVSYDIIGDGNELLQLISLVESKKLENIIKIHGRIPHFELKPFFDKCNVGISYVPMTDFYNFQPPTKTFEYILSGMPCIATKTYENVKFISEKNGVLCHDNPESFCESLEYLLSQKKIYKSSVIRETLIDHTWKKIVDNDLKPLLRSINV